MNWQIGSWCYSRHQNMTNYDGCTIVGLPLQNLKFFIFFRFWPKDENKYTRLSRIIRSVWQLTCRCPQPNILFTKNRFWQANSGVLWYCFYYPKKTAPFTLIRKRLPTPGLCYSGASRRPLSIEHYRFDLALQLLKLQGFKIKKRRSSVLATRRFCPTSLYTTI